MTVAQRHQTPPIDQVDTDGYELNIENSLNLGVN